MAQMINPLSQLNQFILKLFSLSAKVGGQIINHNGFFFRSELGAAADHGIDDGFPLGGRVVR